MSRFRQLEEASVVPTSRDDLVSTIIGVLLCWTITMTVALKRKLKRKEIWSKWNVTGFKYLFVFNYSIIFNKKYPFINIFWLKIVNNLFMIWVNRIQLKGIRIVKMYKPDFRNSTLSIILNLMALLILVWNISTQQFTIIVYFTSYFSNLKSKINYIKPQIK